MSSSTGWWAGGTVCHPSGCGHMVLSQEVKAVKNTGKVRTPIHTHTITYSPSFCRTTVPQEGGQCEEGKREGGRRDSKMPVVTKNRSC